MFLSVVFDCDNFLIFQISVVFNMSVFIYKYIYIYVCHRILFDVIANITR
jgi:hypothetical protein